MFASNQEQIRGTLIPLLNARLADAIDLQFQAKQAHWNVTGPEFFALHELFDEVSKEVRKQVDEIAERVAQLGGFVEGTIRLAAEHTSLSEYPRDLPNGDAHVEALTNALDAAAEAMREAIDRSASLGDQVTADIFTEATRTFDKLLWMVRAHRSAEAGARPDSERQVEAAAPAHH